MRQTDPTAQQLLNQMVAAHQALFAFSAQVKVEAVSDKSREVATATILYQKPNKARVEVTRSSGDKVLSVCDGINRLYMASITKKKQKAESGEKALVETLSQANLFIAPVFLYLSSRAAPVRGLLPGTVKTMGFGTPLTMDGVAVEVVAADVATKDGEARITFTIGKDDRLLRRLMVQTSYQKENFTLAETYTNIQANPKVDKKSFVVS
ncbi:DUF2092 domain-containing protein [Armatimonas sp.]|uniref:DUF2092 domain-containing protein n=1 Tax=Armatimonas sp. TaxID=1872638 RepID=UPI00286A26F4|nr:DUF2092 domain-containing protein [Armatimonas sp.]